MIARLAGTALLFLAAAHAPAARYDSGAQRSAMLQAASACRASVTDAAALALEPEKASAIGAGLDEGARQAGAASLAARALEGDAQARAAEMAAAVKPAALDLKLAALGEPVAAERLRRERLAAERDELGRLIDALPEEERKKVMPLLERAGASLQEAGEVLRPLEDALKAAGLQALEMKEARRESARPLVELSSGAAATISRAEALPAAAAEAKSRLAALGIEPRALARSRASEKLELVREGARLLFESADSAGNRAEDFRRRAAAFETAFSAYEKARLLAASGPSGAKTRLDEARKALADIRERLKPKR